MFRAFPHWLSDLPPGTEAAAVPSAPVGGCGLTLGDRGRALHERVIHEVRQRESARERELDLRDDLARGFLDCEDADR